MPNRLVILAKLLGLCCLGGLVGPRLRAKASADWDAGFMFDQYALTLELGQRAEALGPLFYRQEKDSERTLAVSPLFSHTSDQVTEAEEFDMVYPLLTYDRFGREYRWQLLQLLSLSGGQNQQEISRTRFTLFPIYFQQRSPDPSHNYTALLPVYGQIKQRLLRDEIFFVLFPLYSQTRKRDVVTDNYLYPFFHLRHGEALHGWQFWPLVGQEHKGVTAKTNGFGETEIIGGHDKFFALWPAYLNNSLGIGTENPQKEFGILPFYNSVRSPNRDSTGVLWPFFNWIDDREKKYREWDGPWPFVAVARGEGKTITRFFPLFSRASNTNLQSNFYLWPVYKYNRVHSDALDRDRTRILFFLYSEVSEKNTETGTARERTDFWPLFTHRRDFNGNTRLQLFSLLEPILPNNKSIERNWSPLWSVWRAEKNPKTGDASQSLLWNLYRRETTGSDRKCSLLFGLFQYQSAEKARRFRLFYIPIGKNQTKQNSGTK
jgi:hypothetical protein